MSLLRRLLPAFCTLALAGTAAAAGPRAPAPAEPPPARLDDSLPDELPGDVEIDEIDRAARVRTGNARTLRCWQRGQLIVERPIHAAPPESLRAVELGGDAGAMQLYDLKNSTCLIE